MMFFLPIVLFTALITCCYASPLASRSVHETRPAADQWVKGDRVKPDEVVQVKIALTQSNLDKGYDMLMEVSDPDSAKYAEHYTIDQVNSIFSPSEKTIASVQKWLVESEGVDSEKLTLTPNRGWFVFESSIKQAEALFSTQYYYFKNVKSHQIGLACDEYSLPESVKEYVDYVSPGVGLDSLFPVKIKTSPASSATEANVDEQRPLPKSCQSGKIGTPECLGELYQIPAPQYTKPNPTNGMGIYEVAERFSQAHLNSFFRDYYPAIPQGTGPIIDRIDGASLNNTEFDNIESAIDFDVAFPLLYPQNITLFQAPKTNYANNNSIYGAFFDAIDGSYCVKSKVRKKKLECGVFQPTNVISISYAQTEAYLSVPVMKRQCNEFMKLGLRGVSVIVASGDYGTGAPPMLPSFNKCLGKGYSVYAPFWPASCPYVTTAGGTKFETKEIPHRQAVVQERAVHFGGGGFSNVYTRGEYAGYQQKAVEYFFTHHDPPFPSYNCRDNNYPKGNQTARYNRIGRAFPDVAADSGPVSIELEHKFAAYGTSVSTPIVASILNRINEERLHNGKKPIGFANPAFYKNPSMFSDIIYGDIWGCDGYDHGFNATTKWDPATGLGSPIYPKMRDYFLSLK